MRFTTAAFALAAFASSAFAHVEMIDPPPFRSKANKLIDQSTVDFDMNAPLKPDGSNFPCKLYHEDFGTSPAGDPTATWAAGSPQKITLDGEATHNGGSCQLSLSYDQGKTFRVIKSIEGSCAGNGNKFDFTVPADAKSGDAIFAWTWFNHTGNREMYMNCAAVTITGSGTSTLEDRPEIFTANINNDCKTTEGTDVVFPNPGPDLQVLSDANLGPPSGQGCEAPSSPAPAPEESGDPTDPDQPTGSVDPTESVDPTSSVNATKTKEPVSTSKSKAPTSTSDAPASTSTSPTGTEYVVKSGDICVNIAEQQGVSLSTLFQLNPEVNKQCTNLKPGDVLILRRRSRIMRDLH